MRIVLFMLLFTLFSGASLLAQDDEKSKNSLEGVPFKERIYVGGDLGLNFGTTTVINIAPIVGYRLNKQWSAGLGAKYIYFRYRDPFSGWQYSNSMYGGSVFSRYLIGQNFLLHGEFETINTEVYEPFVGGISREWVNMAFVGAGYRQGMGNTYFQLMALYDIINDRNSPYAGQYIFGPDVPIIIRGGIVIGL